MASAPAVAATSDPRFSTPGYTIVDWAIDLLTGLGIKPTPTRISMLTTWANHESGGYNSGSSGGLNNPLNTTERTAVQGGRTITAISQGGSQGNIQNFGSPSDGVAVQVKNLSASNFGYPAIVAALRAENPDSFFGAIDSSAFGTHFAGHVQLDNGTSGSPSGPSGTSAGGGGIAADLQNSVSDAIAGIPFFGSVFTGAQATAKFEGQLLGLFVNWRYVVEVMAGLVLMGAGFLIILIDTGLAKKGVQAAGTAAAVGAIA